MMNYNSRLFTDKELSNGARYTRIFINETEVKVFREDGTVKGVYERKHILQVLARYQAIIHELEWKKLKEEFQEGFEYRNGRKIF